MRAAAELTDPRLDIGANNPPGKVELERHAELMATVEPWIASRPEIEDSDEATAAQGLIDKLRTLGKDLAKAQKLELVPHEEAVAEVKAKYRGPIDALDVPLKQLLKKAGDWITKKRARVAAERTAQEAEAKRLRDEAARLERESQEASRKAASDIEGAHEAARVAHTAATVAKTAEKAVAKMPDKVIIKGSAGTKSVNLRAYWRAEITDEALALKSYEGHPATRKACLDVALQLANESARASKSEDAALAGFRFIKEERAY
jgi:hypothetical protein